MAGAGRTQLIELLTAGAEVASFVRNPTGERSKMKTATLVQATAEVVTVVSLRPGDVVKRLVDQGANYGDDRYKGVFAVVQSVDSNGEDTMVSAVELAEDYSGVPVVRHKVFGTDVDLKIFAATPGEIAAKFAGYRQALDRKIDTKTRELEDASKELQRFHEIASAFDKGELSSPIVQAIAGD